MNVSVVVLCLFLLALAAASQDDGHQQKDFERPPGDHQPHKEVHENVKAVIVTKKVPVPYPVQVEKKIPYPVKVTVRRPYTVIVPKPYLVEVQKPVPYALKVPVPQPYTVEKHVPVAYRVPVDKPVPVQVPKPYPVFVEKKVPYPVDKHVPVHVQVPVERPYAVPVPVDKPVPVTVEKPVPVPVAVPVERPVPVTVEKPYPVHLDNLVPYQVEKYVPYPVPSGGQKKPSAYQYPPSPSPNFIPSPQDTSLNSDYTVSGTYSVPSDNDASSSSYFPDGARQSSYSLGNSAQSAALVSTPVETAYFRSEDQGHVAANHAQSPYLSGNEAHHHLAYQTTRPQHNFFQSYQGHTHGNNPGHTNYFHNVGQTNFIPENNSAPPQRSQNYGQYAYLQQNNTQQSNAQHVQTQVTGYMSVVPVSANYIPESSKFQAGYHGQNQQFGTQMHRGYYPRIYESHNSMKHHANFKEGPPTSYISYQQQSPHRPHLQPHHHQAHKHFSEPLQTSHTHAAESFFQHAAPVKSSSVPIQHITGIRPLNKPRPFRVTPQRVVSTYSVQENNDPKKNHLLQPTAAALLPTTYSPANHRGSYQFYAVAPNAPNTVKSDYGLHHFQNFQAPQPTFASSLHHKEFKKPQEVITIENSIRHQQIQSPHPAPVSPTQQAQFQSNLSPSSLIPTPVMLIQTQQNDVQTRTVTYLPEGNYSVQTTSAYPTRTSAPDIPQVLALVASPKLEQTTKSPEDPANQEMRPTTVFLPQETTAPYYHSEFQAASESMKIPYVATRDTGASAGATTVQEYNEENTPKTHKRKGHKTKGRVSNYSKIQNEEQATSGGKAGRSKAKKRVHRLHKPQQENSPTEEPKTTAALETPQTTPLEQNPIVVQGLEDQQPSPSPSQPSPTVETTTEEDVSRVHVAQYEAGEVQVLQSQTQVFHPTPASETSKEHKTEPATSYTEVKRSFGKRTRRLTKNNGYIKPTQSSNKEKKV